MGDNNVASIGKMLMQTQSGQSVTGVDGADIGTTFRKMVDQMTQIPGSSVSTGSQTAQNMQQLTPHSPEQNYDRYQYQKNKIPEQSTKDWTAGSQVSEKLESFEESVRDVIKDELQVTDEQITEAMETLGLTVADLMNPQQLAALAAELTGTEDMSALLCNEAFMNVMQSVGTLTEDLLQELGVTAEELTQLLEDAGQADMNADLMQTGAIVKTAFCGPCFGAGDTPANNAFSIRHSTRNFPNREGSKLQNGQISSVALMDARSIAATAANKGYLTPATDVEASDFIPKYHFDKTIYDNRVFDSKGVADPSVEIQFGPNIKDWPEMSALPQNMLLKVVSEIHDPVTTTDELIPSGETSSYRSNPLGLAEFALSRKDPAYVGLAKEVQKAQKAIEAGEDAAEAFPEVKDILATVKESYADVTQDNLGIGSTIFAVKPGDGSAREQAASCQKVLGGWANIANEYATKRYRSNLINWGMLPFTIKKGDLPFKNKDYIFVPEIRKAVEDKLTSIPAYVVNEGMKEITLTLGELTDDEREIILKGCLINYYRD